MTTNRLHLSSSYEELAALAATGEHTIDCTGDVVVGDQVKFVRANFSGSHRNPKFGGYTLVDATVVADSYGADRQQHTFTLEDGAGSRFHIKGRNLYRNGVWRRPWEDEAARRAARAEKHERGDAARAARDGRW